MKSTFEAPAAKERLRPNVDAWDGLRAVVESTSVLKLDAIRLVPVSAFLAIGYCVAHQADWIPYASIVTIALGTMLVLKGSVNVATSIESSKDPPQPRNLEVGAAAPREAQGAD